MFSPWKLFVAGLWITTLPVLAEAQPRVPDEEMIGIGGDVGILFPSEELETALTLDGSFEYYLTPRFSLRTRLGWTDPEFDISGTLSLRQVRLTFDAVYNWEGGVVHPFVAGGVGAYFLDLQESGESLGDETKFGVNLGGGVEYFLTRRLTLRGEGRYQFVGHDDLEFDPSGLILSVGLKRYF